MPPTSRPSSPSTRFASALLAALAVAACGDSPDAPEFASIRIGPMGGAVQVATGSLAGAKVEVPAGALSQEVSVAVSPWFAPAEPGFRALGPGVSVEPRRLALLLPATVTVPFDTTFLLGESATVLATDEIGEIVELAPAATGPGGQVAVGVATFSNFWAAERLFGGFATVDYLPLDDGNVWSFGGGVAITVTATTSEPNLEGTTLYRFVIASPQQDLGFYLQRAATGATDLLGELQTAGASFQQVHDPTVFLPQAVTIGRPVRAAFAFGRYEPYGATEPTSSGIADTRLTPELPPPVTTALGTFDDLLQVTLSWTLRDASGGERALSAALTLAGDVGPVAVEVFGVSLTLESGTVGGQPIGE